MSPEEILDAAQGEGRRDRGQGDGPGLRLPLAARVLHFSTAVYNGTMPGFRRYEFWCSMRA
jgi:hypothetical protein